MVAPRHRAAVGKQGFGPRARARFPGKPCLPEGIRWNSARGALGGGNSHATRRVGLAGKFSRDSEDPDPAESPCSDPSDRPLFTSAYTADREACSIDPYNKSELQNSTYKIVEQVLEMGRGQCA